MRKAIASAAKSNVQKHFQVMQTSYLTHAANHVERHALRALIIHVNIPVQLHVIQVLVTNAQEFQTLASVSVEKQRIVYVVVNLMQEHLVGLLVAKS
ncbi:hypothetical protein SmJEL517_g00479 [Synchytrium microbalum]|uniref:Uncharacterized protein n=1 Tax=Synchytrium microbalum TaxID=1806994 RepID=A0A507C7M8_9FUNG|nr:uncharacterized protein SmJEL517_g00479 [Synchytrium microbalum]TPX37580.1 hypothetical protein SmJEL517_g00479 [Synchytrium microbalum]